MSATSASGARSTVSFARVLSVWGLLILLIFLILLFSILKPDTFLTAFTFQSLVNNRSINALVSLAVMIPLAANQFDLSVASISASPRCWPTGCRRSRAGRGRRPARPCFCSAGWSG